MADNLSVYNARQEMLRRDFEIQHKRDNYLKDVELHHHDFYEIYYLVSGHVTYVIEGRLCRVMPGDLLLVSPKELHQLSIESDLAPYERYVLWLDRGMIQRLSTELTDLEHWLNPLTPGYRNLLRLTPEQQITVRNLMEWVFQESGKQRFGCDVLWDSLITQLLVQINRLADRSRREAETFIHSNKIVNQVVAYVNDHYREKLTLDDLAERFFVSKYHLSHEFRVHMGTSVYRYIQKKRLQIARQLIAQGEHPTNASNLCGFGDYPGFYRAFTAEYNVSPRQYADSLKNSEITP